MEALVLDTRSLKPGPPSCIVHQRAVAVPWPSACRPCIRRWADWSHPPHLLTLVLSWGMSPRAVAVLGLGLLAMSEELGGQMAHRALEHLLQYGEPAVR